MSYSRGINLVAATLLSGMIVLHAVGEQPARRPSLDALFGRASAYWELLAKGKKDQAMEYVQPRSRDNFLARQTPDFSNPHITDLELSPIPAEVWVTVKVRRRLPLIPTPFDWPVKEKWVFEGGKWLVAITKSSTPFTAVTGTKPASPTLSPEEAEKDLQSIVEALRFENSSIDFGLVRQGQRVPLTLTYRLTGSEAMTWKLKGAPRGLAGSGSGNRELIPGEVQKLELRLLTQDYDGELSEIFTVLAARAGVEVPYEFRLHGYVYTPVSVSPRTLRFLKGESSKEITLRNNSKSELRIISLHSRKEGFDVLPLPQTVAPGAECRLTVKLKLRSYPTNHSDNLVLRFESPVDELRSAVLSVIVNYEPVDMWQRAPWEKPGESPKPQSKPQP